MPRSATRNRLFVGYIPTLHSGYIAALEACHPQEVGVFDHTITGQLDYLRKDIRALAPDIVVSALRGIGYVARVIDKDMLDEIVRSHQSITMPDDDLTRLLMEQYPEANINTYPVFLRWDRDNSQEKNSITPDKTVSIDGDHFLTRALSTERMKSSNWWRRVAAAIVTNSGNLELISHNSSLPTEHTSWLHGDPRITAKRGEAIDRSIDIHAEARLIAQAAHKGIRLEGKSLYVTTFPCPNCAKLISTAGIRACYFIDGYATIDGYDILKSFGVTLIKVNVKLAKEDPRSLLAYPPS